MNKISLLIMLGLLSTVTSVFSSPVQWIGNGHYYEVEMKSDLVNWNDARSEAISKGGYLATITSEAENNFLISTFGEVIRLKYLGGYQYDTSNEPIEGWRWVEESGDTWGYTNWGENGNYNPVLEVTEDYLSYWGVGDLGQWNDSAPNQQNIYGYIIEYNTEPIAVPEPVSLVLMVASFVGLSLRKRRL